MIIRPKIRGFLCTTAHPKGCEAHVLEQINYVKSKGPISHGPKKVLIIGASTGYGLATRITAAFACKAATLGVSFEREPSEDSTGSAGWYNTAAFEKQAKAQGLYATSINGDAFSDAIREATLERIKKDLGQVDLVVYSIASPKRTVPTTGQTAKSVLKPIGQTFSSKTLDTDKKEIKTITIEPATEQEIQDTVTVMGGEDWELWLQALDSNGVIAPGCKTIAYTYLGAKPTWSIYGKGSIGKAKQDLERATKVINERLKPHQGAAYLGVMKAIVTQASSAIPVMPLYISLLYKIMKEKNIHEGCIEQIQRLFATRLYGKESNSQSSNVNSQIVQTDEAGRIRMDDLELRPEVQQAVEDRWNDVTSDNLFEITDFRGYQADFLKLFGFGFASINYDEDVSPIV